ncbi:MAG TPA: TMEM175 family protein [Nitrososphaerales archaeon]|nr:TMEM175 family protein [Nitrososphaerales archaeon]
MEQRAETRPRPRIETLSDLVFGLALSIGAFALVSSPPVDARGFYSDIVTFGFNFVVLISMWIRYTRIMSALPIETRRTMFLNTLLLFTVSLEPFVFNILRSGNSATQPAPSLYEAASSFFGVDVGAMMLIMGVFTLALADEEKRLVPREMIRHLRSEAGIWFTSSAIFLVSALPFFGKIMLGPASVSGLSVRQYLWTAALIISWVKGRALSSSGLAEI